MTDNDSITFRVDSYSKHMSDRILKESGSNHSEYLRKCIHDLIDKDERKSLNLIEKTIEHAKEIGKEVSKIYDEAYKRIVK